MKHLLSTTQLTDIGNGLPAFLPAFEEALARRTHGDEPTPQELALAINDAAESAAVELLQARLPGVAVECRIPGWVYVVGGEIKLTVAYHGWIVTSPLGGGTRHKTFLAAVRRAVSLARSLGVAA